MKFYALIQRYTNELIIDTIFKSKEDAEKFADKIDFSQDFYNIEELHIYNE